LQTSDKALSINPKNIDVLITKSSTLFQLGNYRDALQTSEQALVIDPKNAAAWTNKGNSLSGLQRYSEAVQAYDKAIEFAQPQSLALEGAKQNKILAQNMISSSTQIPGTTLTVSESVPVTKSPLLFSTAIIASLFVGVYWRIKKKI
jgi:tetratricopeptide (TPR) repeat protein